MLKNINDKNGSVDILYLIREIETKRFEYIEIKSITCEMKNLLEILKSRSELTEEIISKLEDKQ